MYKREEYRWLNHPFNLRSRTFLCPESPTDENINNWTVPLKFHPTFYGPQRGSTLQSLHLYSNYTNCLAGSVRKQDFLLESRNSFSDASRLHPLAMPRTESNFLPSSSSREGAASQLLLACFVSILGRQCSPSSPPDPHALFKQHAHYDHRLPKNDHSTVDDDVHANLACFYHSNFSKLLSTTHHEPSPAPAAIVPSGPWQVVYPSSNWYYVLHLHQASASTVLFWINPSRAECFRKTWKRIWNEMYLGTKS